MAPAGRTPSTPPTTERPRSAWPSLCAWTCEPMIAPSVEPDRITNGFPFGPTIRSPAYQPAIEPSAASGHWRRKRRGEGGGGILRTWRTHGTLGRGTVSVRKGPAGSAVGTGAGGGAGGDADRVSWAR